MSSILLLKASEVAIAMCQALRIHGSYRGSWNQPGPRLSAACPSKTGRPPALEGVVVIKKAFGQEQQSAGKQGGGVCSLTTWLRPRLQDGRGTFNVIQLVAEGSGVEGARIRVC